MSFAAEQNFAVESKLLQTLPSEISNENISQEIPSQALKVYKRRWYILLIFSLVSMEQSLFWITFTPVADDSFKFFGWGAPTLNFLLAIGCIVGLPTFFIASWSLSTPSGVRWSIITCAALQFLGSAIRLFAILGPKESWAIYVVSFAQSLVAFSGPFVMGGCTKLSSIWFPPSERTFATSISASANNFGNALGFVIGPLLVDHFGMKWYLYIEAIIGFTLMIITFIYFPESPPLPPSISASQESEAFSIREFLSDCIQILKNWPYVLLVSVGGLQSGVFSAWQGMFDYILGPSGYSSQTIGWIANGNIFGGVLGSILAGLLLDKIFLHRFKESIIVLFFLGSCYLVIFTLSFPSPISEVPILYSPPCSLITLIGFLLGCTYPIFYEFGVELTYPVRESSTSSFFILLLNFNALVFFFVNSYIPVKWINAIVTITVIVSTMALLIVKNEYRRAKIDYASDTKDE